MRRLAAYGMLTLYACGMRFSWTGRLMFGTGGSMFSRTDTNPNTSTARLAPVALHHVLMCFVQRYLFLVLIAILGGGDAARSHGTEGETRILPPNAGNTGHEGLPGTHRVFSFVSIIGNGSQYCCEEEALRRCCRTVCGHGKSVDTGVAFLDQVWRTGTAILVRRGLRRPNCDFPH